MQFYLKSYLVSKVDTLLERFGLFGSKVKHAFAFNLKRSLPQM